MLSLPFHRRHLHRTIWVMLLAWVLALLAGIANACQLETHAPVAPATATSTRDRSTQRGVHAAQSLQVEHGHHDGHSEHDGSTTDAAKNGCLKFCDDESSTVVNGKTPQTDLPGPVVFASVEWHSAMPTAAAGVAMWRPIERPASQGPPLVIRFLRLTI